MKKLLVLPLLFLINIVFAQSEIEIKYEKDGLIYLNEVKINKSTSLDDIKKVLGEPVLYKEYKATGKVNYHYKELGVAIRTVDDKLLFIGVNFNWDGDKTFPETAYSGKLNMNGNEINLNTSEKDLEKLDIKFVCPMPGMCVNKNSNPTTYTIVGFEDDKVTQVGFEFH